MTLKDAERQETIHPPSQRTTGLPVGEWKSSASADVAPQGAWDGTTGLPVGLHLIAEAINEVVLPAVTEIIRQELAPIRKTQNQHTVMLQGHTDTLDGHGQRLVRIEVKLDAQMKVSDRLETRVDRLEKHVNLAA